MCMCNFDVSLSGERMSIGLTCFKQVVKHFLKVEVKYD